MIDSLPSCEYNYRLSFMVKSFSPDDPECRLPDDLKAFAFDAATVWLYMRERRKTKRAPAGLVERMTTSPRWTKFFETRTLSASEMDALVRCLEYADAIQVQIDQLFDSGVMSEAEAEWHLRSFR